MYYSQSRRKITTKAKHASLGARRKLLNSSHKADHIVWHRQIELVKITSRDGAILQVDSHEEVIRSLLVIRKGDGSPQIFQVVREGLCRDFLRCRLLINRACLKLESNSRSTIYRELA